MPIEDKRGDRNADLQGQGSPIRGDAGPPEQSAILVEENSGVAFAEGSGAIEQRRSGSPNPVRDAGPQEMRDDGEEWDEVDEGSDESFPASDPSSYSLPKRR